MYTNTFTKSTELTKYIHIDLPICISLAHRVTSQHTKTQTINQRSFNKHTHKSESQQTSEMKRNKHTDPHKPHVYCNIHHFLRTGQLIMDIRNRYTTNLCVFVTLSKNKETNRIHLYISKDKAHSHL